MRSIQNYNEEHNITIIPTPNYRYTTYCSNKVIYTLHYKTCLLTPTTQHWIAIILKMNVLPIVT